MKCPKCGYLGFETSDRCRHCGYDFSLSVASESPAELPLRSDESAGGALADFDLRRTPVPAETSDSASSGIDRPIAPSKVATLPLFGAGSSDDGPSFTPPPARPPLAVRRTTPEIPRGRARSTPPSRVTEPDLLESTSVATLEEKQERPEQPADTVRDRSEQLHAAGRGARVIATIVDVVLLAIIDAVVIYLTLAMSGLATSEAVRLPWLPLAGFLLILNGGYLVAFIAASGQTIGKMLAGIRVIGDDGERVDIGGAVLRAAGCVLSLLSAGLGYLPAFVTADGRALQDRMSGTRVVSAR
jgi:uncharacterized RDD family membrane protein YckC